MALEILGQAWHISQKGEEIITENNAIKDRATILKNALNTDLKEIGEPILTKLQTKSTISQVVLQIQKIRNVAAPKANENSHVAPRMLKLVLTDGDSYIQAIETASIPFLHLDKTLPGSKLLINSAKLCSGYILLDASNCSLLGGQVPALYEKWELAKSIQSHNRQASTDGPPAWINFGRKIQSDLDDKSFKSLDNKTQENKENTKFDLQRQDAIAEATSGAVKKVFGGGAKQTVQATASPRNRQNEFKDRRNNKNNKSTVKDLEDKPQKPSEKVSLFDFLEDKLPPNESNNISIVEPVKPTINNHNSKNQPSNQQNNKNRTYQNSKNTYDQNNSYRPKSENRPKPPQNKPEDSVNGLSNNFSNMSLNTQFASRSLKQHLNLGPQKKNDVENTSNIVWKTGDDCVAKYWEDGKYYNAFITAVTEKTCVVKFKGYGNIEEVLKSDCLPVTKDKQKPSLHAGPVEFKRNTRTYRRQ